jgi:hypothetical protein
MKKKNQSAHGRYVSADKVQSMLNQLGVELASERKRMRVGRTDNAIIIYANGGTVNITFKEKGGSDDSGLCGRRLPQ